MNKKDVASQLAARANISVVQAQALLNHLFDADSGIITGTLAAETQDDAKVLFAGFGTFQRNTRAGRRGTNPSSGQKMDIEPKEYISFKPGKTLRERIAAMPAGAKA